MGKGRKKDGERVEKKGAGRGEKRRRKVCGVVVAHDDGKRA